MAEKQNKRGKLKQKFRLIDIFGVPVSLVHEGDTMFRTEVGSVFTLIMILVLLTYFIVNFKTVIMQDSNLNYSELVADRDLYDPD